MAAKYWIKLYHEILADPKMGMLPDNLWRRTIELFLLAGELDEQGQLPRTGEIAWLLRQAEETLEADLNRLESVGILTKNADGWLVTNFSKRQAPTETVDRVRQFRQRQRKQQAPPISDDKEVTGVNDSDYANVTKSYTDTESDTESEELLSNDNNVTEAAPLPVELIPEKVGDERPPPPPPPKEQAGYSPTQRNILALFGGKRFKTNIMAETVIELTDKYGHEKVIEAAKWAAKKGMALGDAIISIESALPTWGQPKPTKNGAKHYGTHQRNSGRNDPTGQQLKTEPAYDKHTNELVYPDGTRVPAG